MDVIHGWGCLSTKKIRGISGTHSLALLFHNLVYAKIDFLFRLLFSQRVSHPVGEAPVYPMAVPVFIKLLG